MSDQNSSIKFSVSDNGVSSYIERTRRQATSLASDLARSAIQQTQSAKEQLKIIEDQISAINRRSQVEKQAALDQIKYTRDTRKDRVSDFFHKRMKEIEDSIQSGSVNKIIGERQKSVLESKYKKVTGEVDTQFQENTKQTKNLFTENDSVGKILKALLDETKIGTKEQLGQLRKGKEETVDAIKELPPPLQEISKSIAEQNYKEEKKKEKEQKEKEKEGKAAGWMEFLKALGVEKGLGMLTGFPGAKNELDFVKPLSSITGMAAGGLMGNLMDAADIKIAGFGAGQTSWGTMGTVLGEKAGEMMGEALQRSYEGRENLAGGNLRLEALTGQRLGVEDFGGEKRLGGRGVTADESKWLAERGGDRNKYVGLEEYGVGFEGLPQLQQEIVKRMGKNKDLHNNTENLVALDQGYGINKETSFALLELLRSNRDTDKDLMKVVGGVAQAGAGNIFKGGDRTYLNEFLVRNFTQVQRELLKTQSTVASGTTFDVIRQFDKMGGMFSARDPRSTGLVSQINESISNPGSDNMKALSYQVLRKLHPNANLAQIIEDQQKGFGDPAYFKSMVEAIKQRGGPAWMQQMNIAGAFGVKMEAAGKILNNQWSPFSTEELKGKGEYGEENIRAQGKEYTSVYAKSTAQIQDQFIDDVGKAVRLVGDKMTDLFGDMLSGLKDYIKTALTGEAEPLKVNTTYTSTGAYRNGNGQLVVDGITGPSINPKLLKK